MTEYIIQRGQRTFRASKLGTLRELVRRGYLGPEDLVAVDGGPFVPLRLLAELRNGDVDAPWALWEDARVSEADGEADSADTGGDLLSDFLSGLGDAPKRAPVIAKPRPSRSKGPGSSFLDRAEPPSLSEMADIPQELEVLSAGALEAIELEELPAKPQRGVEAEPQPPATRPEPTEERPTSSQPTLRLVEPTPEAPTAGAPLSFGNWVEDKGASGAGALLENFGVVDDGIVVRRTGGGGPNWWRTVGIVALACVVIALWHTYVRTIALTDYPTEAELVVSQRGDGPTIPGEVADRVVETAPQTALDLERRLRSKVSGDIGAFSNSEDLENLIFQALMNLRVSPTDVNVKPLRLQGAGDVGRDRPIEADISVRLAGVDDDAAVTEIYFERLTLVWLVIAQHSRQGKVNFREVKTAFRQPNPYTKIVEGRRLMEIQSGRRSAKDLLLEEQ